MLPFISLHFLYPFLTTIILFATNTFTADPTRPLITVVYISIVKSKLIHLHGIKVDWIDIRETKPHGYNKKQRPPICTIMTRARQTVWCTDIMCCTATVCIYRSIWLKTSIFRSKRMLTTATCCLWNCWCFRNTQLICRTKRQTTRTYSNNNSKVVAQKTSIFNSTLFTLNSNKLWAVIKSNLELSNKRSNLLYSLFSRTTQMSW